MRYCYFDDWIQKDKNESQKDVRSSVETSVEFDVATIPAELNEFFFVQD